MLRGEKTGRSLALQKFLSELGMHKSDWILYACLFRTTSAYASVKELLAGWRITEEDLRKGGVVQLYHVFEAFEKRDEMVRDKFMPSIDLLSATCSVPASTDLKALLNT